MELAAFASGGNVPSVKQSRGTRNGAASRASSSPPNALTAVRRRDARRGRLGAEPARAAYRVRRGPGTATADAPLVHAVSIASPRARRRSADAR